MNKGIFIRVFLCILTLGIFLYAFINKQNQITELRLQIPAASRELQVIQQENIRLQFEVDQFENPLHLMELARRPQFSHLKHPLVNEIITIQVPAHISHQISDNSHTLSPHLAPQHSESVSHEHYPHRSEKQSEATRERSVQRSGEKYGLREEP